LNSNPVTTTASALQIKTQAAKGRLFVDCGFWGGLIPGNAAGLDELLDAGVAGVKANDSLSGADSRRYATYLASRPPAMEVEAVRRMVRLSRELKCPVHIVHLSAAAALEHASQARQEGLPFSLETCPHYLTLSAEEIGDGRTEFKCAPPIREKSNQERLWRGLREGIIDAVVSDHSPCSPALKLSETGDFLKAWGGVSSLQFGLSLIWTQAQRRGFGLEELARWMSAAPAKLAGLQGRKGSIAPGQDADLVVWNPEEEFTLSREMIQHRHRLTPYLGRKLRGVVKMTFLRGRKVYERGTVIGPPAGETLLRGAADG
jgi:allantoinase